VNHKTIKQERRDNVDRIEVKRFFSLEKRCSGVVLIMTKLENTTLAAIALPVNDLKVRKKVIELLPFLMSRH